MIQHAVEILNQGGLVAFPTETVYGLGADASNPQAVAKIYAAKNRPAQNPLIVHLASIAQLSQWAEHICEDAYRLGEAFWPGPLTLILPKHPAVNTLVTGGQETIGVRIPKHPLALELLQAFGRGVAAPSANQFTHLSPTQAQDVAQALGDQVNLILDGGPCEVGVESTIVDLSQAIPTILRPGMVSAQAISEVLGKHVNSLVNSLGRSTIRAPGMHKVHYAPLTPTIQLAAIDITAYLATLTAEDLPVAVLTHSQQALRAHPQIRNVPMPTDARSYAQALYHTLRMLDNHQFKQIIIERVTGADPLWEAINDRLNKACGRSKQG
jgi:L-threonylcarbamoyladenylate synthase